MGVTYHHYFLQGLVDRLADMTKRAQAVDAQDYAMARAPATPYMREYAARAGNNARVNDLQRQRVVYDAYIKWLHGEYAKGRRPSDYEKKMARRIAESHAIGGRDVKRLEQASPYLVNNEALRGASAVVALSRQQERDWRDRDTSQFKKLENDRFARQQEIADSRGQVQGARMRSAITQMQNTPVRLNPSPLAPSAPAQAPDTQTSLTLSSEQFAKIRADPRRARLFTDPGNRQELLRRAPDLVRQYDAMAARGIPETPEARANREAAAQAAGALAAGRIPARMDARQHPGDMLPAAAKAELAAGDATGDAQYAAWLSAQTAKGKRLSSADKMYARQYFKDDASGMTQKWQDPDISRRMKATGATIAITDLTTPVAAAPAAPAARAPTPVAPAAAAPAAPAARAPTPVAPAAAAPAQPAPVAPAAPPRALPAASHSLSDYTTGVPTPGFQLNLVPQRELPTGAQVRPAAPASLKPAATVRISPELFDGMRVRAPFSQSPVMTSPAAPVSAVNTPAPVSPAAPALKPAPPVPKPPATPKAP